MIAVSMAQTSNCAYIASMPAESYPKGCFIARRARDWLGGNAAAMDQTVD